MACGDSPRGRAGVRIHTEEFCSARRPLKAGSAGGRLVLPIPVCSVRSESIVIDCIPPVFSELTEPENSVPIPPKGGAARNGANPGLLGGTAENGGQDGGKDGGQDDVNISTSRERSSWCCWASASCMKHVGAPESAGLEYQGGWGMFTYGVPGSDGRSMQKEG